MRASRRLRATPTISDVARAAGVSPMTVSRVINGEAGVRPATRAGVEAAITALRYQPNGAARALAGAGPCRLGLLYSNPSAGYLSECLLGGLDQASRQDAQLVLERCELGDHELAVAQHLIAGGIDGIILISPLCDSAPLTRMLAAERVPTVLVGSGRPADDHHAVGIDEQGAAREMTRHLLALGHRRIGFVTGSEVQVASALRLDGHRAALAEAGVADDPALVVPGLYTYRSGLDAAEQLLGSAVPPTAIFASNDDMAAAVIAAAHRRGLDVPGDLTVCGFDDTSLATVIWPELTTIRQPVADMARVAVELLVAVVRRRGGDAVAPVHRLADYTLVRRQSDAVPRQRPAALRVAGTVG